MTAGRSRKNSVKKQQLRRKLLSQVQKKPRNAKPGRDLNIEPLEERQLLAGAQLIGVQPNDGALLQDGDIRNVAPSDLTFRFDQNQIIDENSLKDLVAPIDVTAMNDRIHSG